MLHVSLSPLFPKSSSAASVSPSEDQRCIPVCAEIIPLVFSSLTMILFLLDSSALLLAISAFATLIVQVGEPLYPSESTSIALSLILLQEAQYDNKIIDAQLLRPFAA